MPRLTEGVYIENEHFTLEELEAFENKGPSPFTPVYIALEDAVQQIKELLDTISDMEGEVEQAEDSSRCASQEAHYARLTSQRASDEARLAQDEALSKIWAAEREASRTRRNYF